MINWTISGIVLGLSAAGMLWTAYSSSGTLWACSNKKCENSSIENSFWTTWVKAKHKEYQCN